MKLLISTFLNFKDDQKSHQTCKISVFFTILQVLSHLDQLILVKALVQWYLLVYLVQLGLHIFSTAPHLLQHLALAHMLRTLAYDAGMCQCVRQLVTLVAVLDQRSHAVWESATVIDFAISLKTVVKMWKTFVKVPPLQCTCTCNHEA